jgi:hypothetical protein
MDRSRVNPHAPPQRAPGTCLGAVELWDCPHPLVGRLTVATFLALLMRLNVATVAQRLYEGGCPAVPKAGDQRQAPGTSDVFPVSMSITPTPRANGPTAVSPASAAWTRGSMKPRPAVGLL